MKPARDRVVGAGAVADANRHALVYTKAMLLQPEKYAPAGQYHADVDNAHRSEKPIVYDVKLNPAADLDTVYKTHQPLGKTHAQQGDASHTRAPRAASLEHNAVVAAELGKGR